MNASTRILAFPASRRGTAVIETAILIPLYMIILFSLLFLGYLTLGQQREMQAAAYAAWAGGAQTSDSLLQKFFPWVHPTSADTGSGAGDSETRLQVVTDAVDPNTTFDAGVFEDYIAVLSVGEAYQNFTFGSGGVSTSVGTSRGEFGQYLVDQGFNAGDGHKLSTANSARLTEGINGLGTERWIEIRDATLSYRFKPVYFRWVYNERGADLTEQEYLIGQPPVPETEPNLERSYRVITRGKLQRWAAGDPGGSVAAVLHDMENLMDKTLGDPVDPAKLDAVAASLGYADGQPLYVAR